MKNIEKYKEIVLKHLSRCDIETDIRKQGGKAAIDCPHTLCDECKEKFFKWLLEEYKEPILDEVEREYLSAVIKPFRDKVKFIKLPSYDCLNLIYTCIRMYDNCGNEIVRLPNFKIGTMYKGMKINKNYTPEELGL